MSIVAKARKFATAEMKDAVAEFEECLAQIHGKGKHHTLMGRFYRVSSTVPLGHSSSSI